MEMIKPLILLHPGLKSQATLSWKARLIVAAWTDTDLELMSLKFTFGSLMLPLLKEKGLLGLGFHRKFIFIYDFHSRYSFSSSFSINSLSYSIISISSFERFRLNFFDTSYIYFLLIFPLAEVSIIENSTSKTSFYLFKQTINYFVEFKS
jgi:hypothetical protein